MRFDRKLFVKWFFIEELSSPGLVENGSDLAKIVYFFAYLKYF